MSERPTLYGAPYSVYVRIARLSLEEKGVAYDLVPVDAFAPGGPPAEHRARHPFGRIPAFAWRGFTLFEAGAITRYVDEAFAGPALQPASPEPRARMNQIISLLDAYAYWPLVWDIYVETVSRPERGETPDGAKVAAAFAQARTCLEVLDGLMGESPYMVGETPTLADLHAAPIFAYFVAAPGADALMAERPRLRGWWESVSQRESMRRTPFA